MIGETIIASETCWKGRWRESFDEGTTVVNRSVTALFAFLLATSAVGTAQVAGRLSGTVVDPSGAPIPDASVRLILQGGAAAVGTSSTNVEGFFLFPSVRPESYDVTVEANGFRKNAIRAVKITPAQETPLGVVKLEIGSVTEVVDVTGSAQIVQTNNAEISSTVTSEQLRRLPTMDRSPMALLLTQAGVTTNNRAPSTINGLRVSFVNVTLDGINIQDNFIRDSGLDYQPNRLLLDQVAEVNVGISNNNLSQGGGSAQINFVTPSGTNRYHGSALWSNRNNAFAANSWFSNRDRVALPFLNQNQFGGHRYSLPQCDDRQLDAPFAAHHYAGSRCWRPVGNYRRIDGQRHRQ